MSEDMIPLPDEVSHFFIKFTTKESKEKVMLGLGRKGLHCTLHFGTKSGYFDIHLTSESADKHRTLLKMRHFTLMRLFVYLKGVMFWSIQKYYMNTINIGKLKRHECFAIAMEPENEDILSSFIRIRKKGKHISMRNQFPFDKLADCIIEPDEIIDHPSPVLQIYSSKGGRWRYKGFVMKNPVNPKSRQLYWVSKKSFREFNKAYGAGLINSLHRLEFYNKKRVIKSLIRTYRKRFNVPVKKKAA